MNTWVKREFRPLTEFWKLALLLLLFKATESNRPPHWVSSSLLPSLSSFSLFLCSLLPACLPSFLSCFYFFLSMFSKCLSVFSVGQIQGSNTFEVDPIPNHISSSKNFSHLPNSIVLSAVYLKIFSETSENFPKYKNSIIELLIQVSWNHIINFKYLGKNIWETGCFFFFIDQLF